MALAMASIAAFCGSSQEVLEGSLHSSRLSTGKTARIAVARPGFRVRAQQQNSAEMTETSRRALLGFGAAGLVSGSFVQAVLSGGLQRGEPMAMAAAAAAAAPQVVKVAAICGSLSKNSSNRGLIRAAIELSKSIEGLEIQDVDITQLPFLNTDLENVNGQIYPKEVNEFRAKILAADSILFASPEYNYSVTGPLKNAIDWASRPPNVMDDKTAAMLSTGADLGGARSQYHLRQIGVILNLHLINRPELFINAYTSPPTFDKNGNLINDAVRQSVKEVLLSLYDYTLRLRRKTA